MTTAAAFLAACAKEIGTLEDPPNSNRTRYAAIAGHANGYAWCHTFVVAMAKLNQVVIPDGVAATAYTPSGVAAWKAAGRWHASPEPGDFVYYQFDSDPQVDHVGIVEAIHPDGTITAIEGNTNPTSSGSQSNGGGVWRRRRALRLCVGFGRPTFTAPPTPPQPPADDLEDDDMLICFRDPRDSAVWLVERGKRRHIKRLELDSLAAVGAVPASPPIPDAEHVDFLLMKYPPA